MQAELEDDILKTEETRYLLSSPGFVALLSALIMGLGQLFNGQLKKAMVFFFAELGVFLYFLDFLKSRVVADVITTLVGHSLYVTFLVILALGGVLLWLYNIMDAYRVAQFLSFIYDRSMPQMVEDDEALYLTQLNLGSTNVKLRRGFSLKSIYMVAGLAAYSLGIMTLGSYFLASNEELALRSSLESAPRSVPTHLRLGELYLGQHELEKARVALETALKLAEEAGETRLAYHAYTSLARVYADLGETKRANRMLSEAVSLYAVPLTPLPEPSPSVSVTPPVSDLPVNAPPRTPGSKEAAPVPPAPGSPAPATAQTVEPPSVEHATQGGLVLPPPTPTPAPATATATASASTSTSDEQPLQIALGAHSPRLESTLAMDGEEASYAAGDAGPDGSDPASAIKKLLRKARTAYTLKNFAETQKLLSICKEKGADTLEYHALAGRVLEATGQWAPAAVHLKRAIDLGSRNPETRFLVALALVNTGDREKAVPYLEAYLKERPGDTDALIIQTNLLLERSETERAKKLVGEALVARPGDLKLLSQDFSIALAMNNEERAYQTALLVVKSRGDDTRFLRSIVDKALEKGYPELASRIASAAITQKPTHPLPYFLKGQVLGRLGDQPRSLNYFERAVALGGQDPELYFEMAMVQKQDGGAQQAIQSLKAALAKRPDYIPCLRELAELYRISGDYSEARNIYAQTLALRPDDLLTKIGLGKCLIKMGDLKAARRTFQDVLAKSPTSQEAQRWLEKIDQGKGQDAGHPAQTRASPAASVPPPDTHRAAPAAVARDREARGSVAPVSQRDPESGARRASRPRTPEEPVASTASGEDSSDPSRILSQADEALKSGDNEKAEKLYSRAHQAKPSAFKPLFGRGRALKALGKPYEALSDFEAARALAPKDVALLSELGQQYTALDLPNEAIQALEDLLQQDPKNLAGRYALGVNYEKVKRFARAEEQYRLLSYHYPRLVEAHDYLGNLYFSQGRYSMASREYRKVSEENPQDTKARFKLAVSLVNEKDERQATKELRTLKDMLSPDDKLYPKVVAYLVKLGQEE